MWSDTIWLESNSRKYCTTDPAEINHNGRNVSDWLPDVADYIVGDIAESNAVRFDSKDEEEE